MPKGGFEPPRLIRDTKDLQVRTHAKLAYKIINIHQLFLGGFTLTVASHKQSFNGAFAGPAINKWFCKGRSKSVPFLISLV
jgi:hypothetical protein